MIIPKKGLFEIKKLIESTVVDVFIAVEGSQFILKAGTSVLMIRLIEGKYPNYQQFIPQKLNHKIVVPRESILSCLKRVSLLANQKSKAKHQDDYRSRCSHFVELNRSKRNGQSV